ncbi:Ubiquitin-conjugating enzyme E2 5 [Sesamum angolense]|uniref:Ubiquitin-conjugating enzyme E2 5 n=1 Tax=Sesamum angolense TaxID=2727404 RepID=A0AAE1WLM7_9LAMI|nr:Ubiquitin-conjugating enzyme E2 5 [Sesamum angolense]
MSSPSKRRDMDVMKLMMSDYTVEPINDGINEFNVEFHGPKERPYEDHPLNGDAASLMMKDKAQYEQKVKEYCERYAKKEHMDNTLTDDSEVEVSDNEAFSDDEVAGRADP